MRSNLVTALFVVAGLGVTGVVTRPLERPAWSAVRAEQPALQLDAVEGGLGQGLTIGLFGGFRAIIADFLWLRTNIAWENLDLPVTQTMIKLVTAVDPRPLYFWLNGARMIAYDMPVWREDALGGRRHISATADRRIRFEQATVALDYLRHGLEFHPGDPLLYIEMANVYQRRLGDLAKAAELYRTAADQPGAPFYAARIYAELLKRLGRYRDAYDWLVKVYPTLPDNDIRAMKPVVLGRIRELEQRLHVPPDQWVEPSAAPAPAGRPHR